MTCSGTASIATGTPTPSWTGTSHKHKRAEVVARRVGDLLAEISKSLRINSVRLCVILDTLRQVNPRVGLQHLRHGESARDSEEDRAHGDDTVGPKQEFVAQTEEE